MIDHWTGERACNHAFRDFLIEHGGFEAEAAAPAIYEAVFANAPRSGGHGS